MPAVADLVLAIAIAVVMGCQSMVDLRRRLSQGLCVRRRLMRALFRGQDVV